MSFHIIKNINYNSKNSTSSHISIHIFCSSIHLIDFIHLSTPSIYLPHSSHQLYLPYLLVYLSIYPNHIPYLSLLFLLDTWLVCRMFLSVDCNTRSVPTIAKLSFILNTHLCWCGGLPINISFQFIFIIVSAGCMA